MSNVGILAFGSIITDPKDEIINGTLEIHKNYTTPFKIEFARKSSSRENAPTLAVLESGSSVKGQIFVLKDEISLSEAKNILYRREVNKVGQADVYIASKVKWMEIRELEDKTICDLIIYASMSPNIENPSALLLAELAIESAKSLKNHTVQGRRDGIQYLFDVKKMGIKTPLMASYENELCRLLEVLNLEEALQKTSLITKKLK